MKKIAAIIAVILLVVAVGTFLAIQSRRQKSSSLVVTQQQPAPTLEEPNNQESIELLPVVKIAKDIENPQKTINYLNGSFGPSSVVVKVGETVIFRNVDYTADWRVLSGTASDKVEIPEFDSKRALSFGESFEFRFTQPGTWAFHNKLTPGNWGVVVVTP